MLNRQLRRNHFYHGVINLALPSELVQQTLKGRLGRETHDIPPRQASPGSSEHGNLDNA